MRWCRCYIFFMVAELLWLLPSRLGWTSFPTHIPKQRIHDETQGSPARAVGSTCRVYPPWWGAVSGAIHLSENPLYRFSARGRFLVPRAWLDEGGLARQVGASLRPRPEGGEAKGERRRNVFLVSRASSVSLIRTTQGQTSRNTRQPTEEPETVRGCSTWPTGLSRLTSAGSNFSRLTACPPRHSDVAFEYSPSGWWCASQFLATPGNVFLECLVHEDVGGSTAAGGESDCAYIRARKSPSFELTAVFEN